MVSLRGLEIERVINGDGNLAADALHKLKFRTGNDLGNEAAETHCAEAMLCGGKRNHGQRANADFAEAVEKIREAVILFRVGDDKRLLRLPDPAGRMAVHRSFAAGFDGSRKTSFENVQAHDVAHGVVKDEGEEIEVHDGMETLGKIVKKCGEVAMLRDGFGHFEQGFELTPGVFERRCGSWFGRGDSGIRHSRQNSIRVGRVSTKLAPEQGVHPR